MFTRNVVIQADDDPGQPTALQLFDPVFGQPIARSIDPELNSAVSEIIQNADERPESVHGFAASEDDLTCTEMDHPTR